LSLFKCASAAAGQPLACRTRWEGIRRERPKIAGGQFHIEGAQGLG
jgi:hypothetical protein